jgi:hypothetical protein
VAHADNAPLCMTKKCACMPSLCAVHAFLVHRPSEKQFVFAFVQTKKQRFFHQQIKRLLINKLSDFLPLFAYKISEYVP